MSTKVRDPRIPKLTVYDIATIVKTNSEGTIFPDVVRMNAALQNAIPPVVFDVNLNYRRFDDILDELRNDQPVIPLLQIEEPGHSLGHAVVVRGFDEANQLVLVNDPLERHRKPSGMPTTQFMNAWNGGDRYMIKVRIGDQKRLTQYPVNVPTRELGEVKNGGG